MQWMLAAVSAVTAAVFGSAACAASVAAAAAPDEGATNALGSISTSREERRRLARESGAACMNSSTFRRLFPEFIPVSNNKMSITTK